MKSSTKFLVTISVILNVLFIGFYLGTFTKTIKNKTCHKKEFDPPIMEKLKDIKGNDFKGHMLEMFKLREEFYKILTSESFDYNAFNETSMRLHQCRDGMMCELSSKIGEIAKTMSYEERKELARALRYHFDRNSKFKKDLMSQKK
jgi:uncharacterized membrane protein